MVVLLQQYKQAANSPYGSRSNPGFQGSPPLISSSHQPSLGMRQLSSIVDRTLGSTLLRWRICGGEMPLSRTCLSSRSSHPLIHKISHIWGTICWPAVTSTHTYAREREHTHQNARKHTHTHTLENLGNKHAHKRAQMDPSIQWFTHTNARRAQVGSHPPLVRALTFFHRNRIPQMMYLRHLAAFAIFMGEEIQRV